MKWPGVKLKIWPKTAAAMVSDILAGALALAAIVAFGVWYWYELAITVT